MYAKDLEEPRYKLLINKREKAGINFNNDPNAFIEHSNSVDDIFPQIEDYNNRITKIEPYIINLNNDPNAFIEHSNSVDDIFPQIEDYNKKRKRKILIIFDDMISHIMSDKKAQQILKDLFIRCRKLNISLCFLTQSYFSGPKDVRLNCTHYILFKLNNRTELQNIAISHSADIDYKDFIKIYRDCTKKLYNFLTIDTTKHKTFLKNIDET